MKCKRCGDKIPEGDLACRRCLTAQCEKSFLDHQRQYIPAILANTAEIVLVYIPGGTAGQISRAWHIQRIGDPRHALCGSEIPENSRKDRILYIALGTTKIPCLRCEEVLDQLIATTKPQRLPSPVSPPIPINRATEACSD